MFASYGCIDETREPVPRPVDRGVEINRWTAVLRVS